MELIEQSLLNTMLIVVILVILIFIGIGVWRIDQRSRANTSRIDRIEGEQRSFDRQLSTIPLEISRQFSELRTDINNNAIRLEKRVDELYKQGK